MPSVRRARTVVRGFSLLFLRHRPDRPEGRLNMDDVKGFLTAIVAFFLGIYWFFKGFLIYRKYRLLADTPEMPIRSIPMGLVEIHGQAKGEEKLISPVTCSPCYLYRVEVRRSHRNKKGERTESHFMTDLNAVKFYLEDDSGKVMVDPRGAELELAKGGHRLFSGEVRFDPAARKESGGRMDPERVGHRPSEDELRAYVSRVASHGNIIDPSTHLDPFDHYYLEEYCIITDNPYDVTGTCVENPKPQDEHDRNLMIKGQNDPTFVISSKAEKDLERELRGRAAKYIFGGAGLSVLALAVILARLYW